MGVDNSRSFLTPAFKHSTHKKLKSNETIDFFLKNHSPAMERFVVVEATQPDDLTAMEKITKLKTQWLNQLH